MNIQQLLQGLPCTCGYPHTCSIGYVAVEPGAAGHLRRLCQNHSATLLVADSNTYAAAGQQTMAALQGRTVRPVIFSGETVLIPDEAAVAAVEKQMDGIDAIVGVGSGVIQDLCKYVSFRRAVPYYIVCTAPSMDGYASNGAAMIMGGMKVTYPAGLPRAILADPAVLKNAPWPMIQAGYGDIVGKYSALNDWKLSQAVNGEYFCQTLYDLTMDMVKDTLALAPGLMRREEDSIRVLMEALITVGIAMSFAGSSRPASGSEHHLSHFFEITGLIHHTPYFPHGIDVAYSSVLTARLREQLLRIPWPAEPYKEERGEYEMRMQRIYRQAAGGCIELQDRTGRYRENRMPVYREKETQLRQILAGMPSAEQMERILGAAGLDMKEFYRMYSRDQIRSALLYAKDLKDRYTVLWMYYDMQSSLREQDFIFQNGDQNVDRG